MTELGAFLLPLAPLLVLLVFLLLGRYPGCDAIVRLGDRLAAVAAAVPRVARRPRRPVPPRAFAPRGGLLIALGIAQRPPPLAAPA
jgi:hypothetical protein